MKNQKIIILILTLVLIMALLSSCGGGGGSKGIAINGRIVNEAGSPLAGGSYSVQGSGTVGGIGADGTFAAISSNTTGNLVLVNTGSGFRFRRLPFDTAGGGSLNLGDIKLPNDSLSKGWGAYSTGNLTTARDLFANHIANSGRDLPDAKNGLGWALTRLGTQEEAFSILLDALGSGFDPEVRTALAMAYLERTAQGEYAIPQAISNLDLAIGAEGYYLSKPLHDNISEDDLTAFRAMLNLLDGRVAAAVADRNAVLGNPQADLNSASEDIIEVVDFFLSQ